MNPIMFEEKLDSALKYDTLLAGCQDGHLGEVIHHHIYIVVTLLGGRET